MKSKLQEFERQKDGYFHFYCPMCENEYKTMDYEQYFCNKDCEWLHWYEEKVRNSHD